MKETATLRDRSANPQRLFEQDRWRREPPHGCDAATDEDVRRPQGIFDEPISWLTGKLEEPFGVGRSFSVKHTSERHALFARDSAQVAGEPKTTEGVAVLFEALLPAFGGMRHLGNGDPSIFGVPIHEADFFGLGELY